MEIAQIIDKALLSGTVNGVTFSMVVTKSIIGGENTSHWTCS